MRRQACGQILRPTLSNPASQVKHTAAAAFVPLSALGPTPAVSWPASASAPSAGTLPPLGDGRVGLAGLKRRRGGLPAAGGVTEPGGVIDQAGRTDIQSSEAGTDDSDDSGRDEAESGRRAAALRPSALDSFPAPDASTAGPEQSAAQLVQDFLRLRRGEWPSAAADLARSMQRDAEAAAAAAAADGDAPKTEDAARVEAMQDGDVAAAAADSDGGKAAWAADIVEGDGAKIDDPATEWELLQQAAADALAEDSDDADGAAEANPAKLIDRAQQAFQRLRRPLPAWGSSGPSSEAEDAAQDPGTPNLN
jgi:hypothetical protein